MQGFWIYHGSEYDTRVLNIPALQRVMNIPKYAWIIPKYTWLFLNKCEYAWICDNIHKYT